MKIAIDITPLKRDHFLAHRVRGTGSYIENLKSSLGKYFPSNTYTFFTRGEKLLKNIDVVHYPYFEPFFLTLPLKKSSPTVVTVHDLIPFVFPKRFPPGIRGKIKWFLQRLSLKSASAIITDSQASKRDIAQYTNISDKMVHVVYLAANEEFKQIKDTLLLDRIRVKYKLPQNFVLYVGDVTWNKNIPTLIKAMKKINLTLVLLGGALVHNDFDRANPWNQDMIKVQELVKNDKRFIRLGFVSNDDLVAIYQLATVFVMPSFYEGFGLPVLEAMATGTPVVTTKGGSLPEVAGEGAFYVDPHKVDSIANGIGEVFFTEKLRKELVRKGFLQAKKFSWEKTAQETMEVYEEVVSKSS